MKNKTEANVQNMYGVKVLHSNESHIVEIIDAKDLEKNDKIIITTRYGKDIAVLLGAVKCLPNKEEGLFQSFIRKATADDIEKYKSNLEKSKKALGVLKNKILELKLDMKPVSAHYLLDEKKILFFFTAEARVDFRRLVKDLVAIFKLRVELRQIGVRDESRVVGGIAVCGRAYCCNGVTDRLKSVSIKMAKEQNLSLNSLKISGPCGRLLCCLSYEYDFYKEEKKKLPSVGTKIRIKNVIYKIIDVNIQSMKITLISEDGSKIEVDRSQFFKKNEKPEWLINGNVKTLV